MINKQLLVVFGTRPEAIKLAPLILELKSRPQMKVLCCATAQHRELTDQMMALFKIQIDFDLDAMASGQTLSMLTSKILQRVASVLEDRRPDAVIVQGDTTTAYVASLAAFYLNIPVAHVEAGLRTYDVWHPFPEEFYRQCIAKIAHWHFAPTQEARRNLVNEGVDKDRIWVTGNTSIDALQRVLRAEKHQISFAPQPFILITLHRRENLGMGLTEVIAAVKHLALEHPDLHFLWPLHPNPKIKQEVERQLSGFGNIYLFPPMDYRQFVLAMRDSLFILTDSGGVQEEAPSVGKPVLVLRQATERQEGLSEGICKLIGIERERIISEVNQLIRNESAYQSMARTVNLYGDGRAARRIAEKLNDELCV